MTYPHSPGGHHGGHQGHQHHGSVAKPVSPAAILAAVGTRYTCPMHPEIVRDAPGSCPICGMALEPLMPSAGDDEIPELRDFSRRFWWTLPLTIVTLGLAMLGHRTDFLTPEQRSGVSSNLEKLYGRGLNLTFEVNPKLVGGLRVRVGSDVYDGSVAARLQQLAETF